MSETQPASPRPDPADEPDRVEHPDPVDVKAATIDARSEDAPEEIEELVEEARSEGRDAALPGEESGSRRAVLVDPDAPGNFVDDHTSPEVPEPNEPA
jgi:hypothetical protein